MAILSKGTTYSDGDQVTSTNLNALVDSATFASGAVDDSTTQLSTGKIVVKDLGIATGKIAASAVTTAKIADSNVTKAKIENVANLKVLGNVSGSAAAPAEVAILDEDNMASNSATSLATQQSIKAYADSKVDGTGAGSFTTLAASGDVTFDTTTLKVDSSNNRVGILTASPAHNLDVNGTARITSTLTLDSNTSNYGGAYDVYRSGAGYLRHRIADQTLSLGVTNTSDTVYYPIVLDTPNDTLIFSNEEGEMARFDTSGNLGIGTASPAHKLDVNSGTTNQVALFESTDETALIELADSTGSVQFITLGSGDLRIATGGSAGGGGSPASGLYITQGQDIGIGDDTPSHKLDVNGTGRFTGVLSADSNLEVSGTIKESVDDGNLVLQGGASGGANIELYGTSHSSAPNGANYDANIHRFRPVDASSNSLNIIQNGNVGINVDTPSCLLDINDDAATGVGIRVTGGGGGGPLARFIRDVSSSGTVEINAAGGDPQFKLTSSGSDVMAIGLDGSENTFQVCAGSTVGSNQVLVVGTNGKVGIGETVPSAPLTVTSTTGGVILPRMTTTQMNNDIASPANGEMIYNTTANKFYGYASGAWVALH